MRVGISRAFSLRRCFHSIFTPTCAPFVHGWRSSYLLHFLAQSSFVKGRGSRTSHLGCACIQARQECSLFQVEAEHPLPRSGEDSPWPRDAVLRQSSSSARTSVYDEINPSVGAMAQEGAPEEVRAGASLVVVGIVSHGQGGQGTRIESGRTVAIDSGTSVTPLHSNH